MQPRAWVLCEVLGRPGLALQGLGWELAEGLPQHLPDHVSTPDQAITAPHRCAPRDGLPEWCSRGPSYPGVRRSCSLGHLTRHPGLSSRESSHHASLRKHGDSIGPIPWPSHSIQGLFQASPGLDPLLSSPKVTPFPGIPHRPQVPCSGSAGPTLCHQDSCFQITLDGHLLQEACLGCRPEANSLKVFSSSSQRRTSTTKRLWKALTEALSCGCRMGGSVFSGGSQGRPHLWARNWHSSDYSCPSPHKRC